MSRRKLSIVHLVVIVLISFALCVLFGIVMSKILPPKSAHAQTEPVEIVVGNAIGTISDSFIEVPIHVGDLTGLEVTDYTFNVNVPCDIVTPWDIRTNGTLSAAISVSFDRQTGEVSVDDSNETPLSGAGILLWLVFQVNQQVGICDIDAVNFVFNDGSPLENVSAAQIDIRPMYVSGITVDLSTSLPLSGVTLKLVGPESLSSTSDAFGEYAIPVSVLGQNWTLTASKVGDTEGAITLDDVIFLLKNRKNGKCDPLFCDVNRDGKVDTKDASEIIRYLNRPHAQSLVGTWFSKPTEKVFSPLNFSVIQNFQLGVIGDANQSGDNAASAEVSQVTFNTNGNSVTVDAISAEGNLHLEFRETEQNEVEITSLTLDGEQQLTEPIVLPLYLELHLPLVSNN